MKGKALIFAAIAGMIGLAWPGVANARHKAHAERVSYPMKADAYRKLVEARIDKVKTVIDKKLDQHAVSAERKKAINKTIDEASKEVRAELDKATADGTVTEVEATKVNALAAGLRGNVKSRLAAEHGKTRDASPKKPDGKDAKASKAKDTKDAKSEKRGAKTA